MNYKKILYNLLIKFIKQFSPRLYHQFQFSVGMYSVQEYITSIPRPIERILKNYFKSNYLTGAEIGVLKGAHAESLLDTLNIGKLYLIDSWKGTLDNYKITKNKFIKNNKVIIIKDKSKNAVQLIKENSLDFVYIDADHSYKGVYRDIWEWSNKVRENGLITGHDVQKTNILRAVIDYCDIKNYEFKITYPDFYIIKTEKL